MWCLFIGVLMMASFGIIVAEEEEEEKVTTMETIILETTTNLVYVHTDLAEADVDEAVNLDAGNYTTMVFNYVNSQFSHPKKMERCYDDYIKCLVSQVAATPTCAYNDMYDWDEGQITADSYCDVYLDNCRRKVRFWRIIDYGLCNSINNKYLPETIRRLFNLKPVKKLIVRGVPFSHTWNN